MGILSNLGHAIGLTADMAWSTWWALVLGFTVTGAVEVFSSEEQMTEYLGDDGWREVGYGTLFGIMSSSCSYSAISMAKTLFKKGASPTAAIGAFMFAATDLVVELGLVMWVLLGWKFVLADFLGGIIAIVVLTLIYRQVPDSWWDEAYETLLELDQTECPACGMAAPPHDEETVETEYDGETIYFCCGGCLNAWEAMNDADAKLVEDEEPPGLLSESGWRKAASNSVREWDMLWDDIAIGFIIAGFIAAFVPRSWWLDLFNADSSGFLWVVYGAVVGVFIGVVTFICSVGNIPFAVVLWSNGLPFGAVLSFVYADLIIPPILNAYRKYYGMRIAVVLFLAMATASVVAGVAIHYIFDFANLLPAQGHAAGTAPDDYTLPLNLIFTALFVAQVTTAYGRDTLGNKGLSIIGTFGEYYYRGEKVFGTAGENYGRFKSVASAMNDVFGATAAAAGDVADSTAATLEKEEQKLAKSEPTDESPDTVPATTESGAAKPESYDHRRASGDEPRSGTESGTTATSDVERTSPDDGSAGSTDATGSKTSPGGLDSSTSVEIRGESDDRGEQREADEADEWTESDDADDTGAFQFADESEFEFGDEPTGGE